MIRISTIIPRAILFCALPLVAAFAQTQQFQREAGTISVMISGVPVSQPFKGGNSRSMPTFVDIDNDSDFDLFVGGGYGKIDFFRNTGTSANPTFVYETSNFISIDVGDMSTPTFADIDADGDFDLFVGSRAGNIHFHRNRGTASNPNLVLETQTFASIFQFESVPTFTDMDNDGDLDLFVGEEDGNINLYRNTGTKRNPVFALETENFASIDIGSYCTPTFVDIDKDGDVDLFVGEAAGNVNFYRNTGTASNPIFSLETENFASINVGGSTNTPTFADIDNDGDFDLFLGENNGNINFYRNTGTATTPSIVLETSNFVFMDLGYDSAPFFADIDHDADFDLFLGERVGNINFFRNTGTASNPIFVLETQDFSSIDVEAESTPALVDIDNDGDLDLFVGVGTGTIFQGGGNIHLYRNTGTASNPIFMRETSNFASIDVGGSNTPTFVDIDNDSDFDLFVGEADGNINFYRNTGTPSNPVFALETENFASIAVGSQSTPTFVDIDDDGDFDLFVGEGNGNINFFLNVGTPSNPVFALETENFASIDVESESFPTFSDIDNDGDFDLFVGETSGGVHFYRNVTPTSVTSRETADAPNTFALNQNYPNPFNPETIIQYQLPKTTQVKLTIYNLVGQRVATLVDGKQHAGFYFVDWDGKDDLGRIVASGVFLYRLETMNFVKVRKLTLLR